MDEFESKLLNQDSSVLYRASLSMVQVSGELLEQTIELLE